MDSRILWRLAGAFVITCGIFVAAFLASDYLNEQRFAEIREIEEEIAIDILSLETQFDLLEDLSCEDIARRPILTEELDTLAERLNYTESSLGVDNPEVVRLKRQYSLLLIKDSLLMERISDECNTKPISLFYFYSNEGDCGACRRQGYILTDLQKEYPSLRVYAFDYNLDLSALDTLIAIHDIEPNLPALMSSSTVHYGFKSRDELTDIIPELFIPEATTTATSTATSTDEEED